MTDPLPTRPTYVSAAEVAALLECHPRTVHRLARRGLIPSPTTVGGLRRWHLADLMTALRAGG